MASYKIDLGEFSKDVILTIEWNLTKEFIVRKWIAANLMKLAAIFLGCGIEFEEGE
jgi:hypothetical protein